MAIQFPTQHTFRQAVVESLVPLKEQGAGDAEGINRMLPARDAPDLKWRMAGRDFDRATCPQLSTVRAEIGIGVRGLHFVVNDGELTLCRAEVLAFDYEVLWVHG